MSTSLDLATFWAQGDAVSHTIAVLLLGLSIASWTVIAGKGWSLWRLRRQAAARMEAFWQAPSLDAGLARLAPLPPFAELAARGAQSVRHYEGHAAETPHLDAHLPVNELVTRGLRQGINGATSRLEAGQTLLASVGSTAPFIGLFGTVWGIYHALARIGSSGQASLDQVAGPVGEALVMTAAGLFVAIPAVLAYNAFNRSLRLIAADLDAFAHDLHTFLTTGRPLAPVQTGGAEPAPRAAAHPARPAALAEVA